MMGVFSNEHQRAIDKINHDGWHYVASRADEIAETFGGNGVVIGDTIHLQTGGVEVAIEEGDPNLEWSLPGEWNLAPHDRRSFTQGFLLSIKANSESTSNKAICSPIDWYMLCIFLQIGLNMAPLGLATSKSDY
jgi:hypothetical protein